MGWGNDFLVKPGTAMMIIFIAAFGIMMFTWTSNYFTTQGESSQEKQENVLDCSSLEISIVDIEQKNSSVEAFFRSNKKVDRIYVNFEGARNVTKLVNDISPGSLQTASANLSNASRLYFSPEGCSKIFER